MNRPDFAQWTERLQYKLWEQDPAGLHPLEAFTIRMARIIHGIALKFADGQFTLWAMSLVYTTLLSLVPLIAVSFSLLKAFGARDRLEVVLLEFLAPLGEQGLEIQAKILSFVDNVNVGVLGSVGVAFLFFTVVSLMQKIEEAFNFIWQVPDTRGLARRFSDYLSVILVGPFLLFAGFGTATSVMDSHTMRWLISIEPIGTLFLIVGWILPYLLISTAFAFMYGFIPNIRVQLKAALVGGLFAGVLWYTLGMIFTTFVATSSSYSAIYSGFAGAILFMIWLYISWLIILVGAQVAFYWQNPRYLDLRGKHRSLGGRRSEELALEVMTLIGEAHYYDKPTWTAEALLGQIRPLHPDAFEEVLQMLKRAGLIVTSADDPPIYLPARDIETMTLEHVVTAVRGQQGSGVQFFAVEEVMEQIDTAISRVLQGRTVKDLVISRYDNNMSILEKNEETQKS